MLSQKQLKALLRYEPESGEFYWLPRKGLTGRRAGSIHGNGYRYIMLFGRQYLAHRLAWLYMTGEWPGGQLDHKNGAAAENKWANLRKATPHQNSANKKKMPNKSGLTGVSHVPLGRPNRRWMAKICVRGKQMYLGSYETPELAHAAYCAAARAHFGEFARAL